MEVIISNTLPSSSSLSSPSSSSLHHRKRRQQKEIHLVLPQELCSDHAGFGWVHDKKRSSPRTPPKSDELGKKELSSNGGSGGRSSKWMVMVAALKIQKVYRSYRTRRKVADSAVVVDELWWQAIDNYARLNHSTISFFNLPETTVSRWARISLNASKVGKGLSQDSKAQKLAFQHWIEAIDPRHRYGHNLNYYYNVWSQTNSGQPFFYWLDVGDGKELELPKSCSRSKLREQCIMYLGPQERAGYEYVIVEGKILHKITNEPLDTTKIAGGSSSKWIFVMSTSERLYIGEKQKGKFHHSSFLAGGATLAAGRLVAEAGVLKSVSAYSGHYRPTNESLETFMKFLNRNGVNLDCVQIGKPDDEQLSSADEFPLRRQTTNPVESTLSSTTAKPNILSPPIDTTERGSEEEEEPTTVLQIDWSPECATLSGGIQSPRGARVVPTKAIIERINSKKWTDTNSRQLGHRLSRKWSTGAGPRIGCVADYPPELRLEALEFNKLSPREPSTTKD